MKIDANRGLICRTAFRGRHDDQKTAWKGRPTLTSATRQGFTLIEMLAVITVSSVVFTVIGFSIFALTRIQSRVEEEAHTAAALHAFAQRLRTDAHAARNFSLETPEDATDDGSAGESLSLATSDRRRVVYDFHPDKAQVRRRVIEDDETRRRDAFTLPRGSTIRWEPPAEGEAPILAAIVSRPAGQEPMEQRPRRETRIEAALGLDRRFSGARSEGASP